MSRRSAGLPVFPSSALRRNPRSPPTPGARRRPAPQAARCRPASCCRRFNWIRRRRRRPSSRRASRWCRRWPRATRRRDSGSEPRLCCSMACGSALSREPPWRYRSWSTFRPVSASTLAAVAGLAGALVVIAGWAKWGTSLRQAPAAPLRLPGRRVSGHRDRQGALALSRLFPVGGAARHGLRPGGLQPGEAGAARPHRRHLGGAAVDPAGGTRLAKLSAGDGPWWVRCPR